MDNNYPEQIAALKRSLRSRHHEQTRALHELEDHVRREAEDIQSELAAGRSPIPQIDYAALRDGRVSDAERARVRKRGALVVRGVFERAQAEAWNAEVVAYVEDNSYYAKEESKRELDQYFSNLQNGRPQIFGLYWSKPQVAARQHPAMAETKRFLNRLWNAGSEFDPDHDYTYADRVRRREPGDNTIGLAPHMDAGSIERWLDPAFQQIYAPVFAGDWQSFEPFNAAGRTRTREIPSPAVCSMFRSFQGWTALTAQGPSDGTLELVPIANGIAYMLLRALADDVDENDLCGAEPGRALRASPDWHAPLLEGLTTIPQVEPGDTVWWHPDVIHGVGAEHHGGDYANVIYIGASPRCEKNRVYVEKQAQAFLAGRSGPDFAAENYETDFRGRATLDDLSELGRSQMGL